MENLSGRLRPLDNGLILTAELNVCGSHERFTERLLCAACWSCQYWVNNCTCKTFFIWQLAYLSPSCATTLTSNKHVQIPIIMKAVSSLRLLCAVGAGAVNNERITVLPLFLSTWQLANLSPLCNNAVKQQACSKSDKTASVPPPVCILHPLKTSLWKKKTRLCK